MLFVGMFTSRVLHCSTHEHLLVVVKQSHSISPSLTFSNTDLPMVHAQRFKHLETLRDLPKAVTSGLSPSLWILYLMQHNVLSIDNKTRPKMRMFPPLYKHRGFSGLCKVNLAGSVRKYKQTERNGSYL